jgi:coenzyme F420 hydrogenase subunit beta
VKVEGMSTKLGFDDLRKQVILKGACMGCGACSVACPFPEVLNYLYGEPRLVGECKVCGICTRICPRYRVDYAEIEELIFGVHNTQKNAFGIHQSMSVARAVDEEIRLRGQDGGVATALLLSALESNLIDGAIVSTTNPSNPWLPVPSIARTRKEILLSAGTKYTYSPGILAIKDVHDKEVKHLAFVGTPCQILAIRRMQGAKLRKLTDPILFNIGLFCSECFTYEGLMVEKIHRGLSVDLSNVEKINIKGRMLVDLKDGKRLEIPIKELKAYAKPQCNYCNDFSAELADVSLGGVGLNGWTLSIVRTDRGKQLFEAALSMHALEVRPVNDFKQALDLLIRISISKRNKALNINSL